MLFGLVYFWEKKWYFLYSSAPDKGLGEQVFGELQVPWELF